MERKGMDELMISAKNYGRKDDEDSGGKKV